MTLPLAVLLLDEAEIEAGEPASHGLNPAVGTHVTLPVACDA